MLGDSYSEILLALHAPDNRRRSPKESPRTLLSRVLDERVQEPRGTKTITKREAIISNFLELVDGGKSTEASHIFWKFLAQQKAKREEEALAEYWVGKDLVEVAKENAKRKRQL